MADGNRILDLRQAADQPAAPRAIPTKVGDRVAQRVHPLWGDTNGLMAPLCRRHAAGSCRLCPPRPRRLAPHEPADADAGSRRQPRARRRSRTQSSASRSGLRTPSSNIWTPGRQRENLQSRPALPLAEIDRKEFMPDTADREVGDSIVPGIRGFLPRGPLGHDCPIRRFVIGRGTRISAVRR